MKNSILYQICAKYEKKNVKKQNWPFQKDLQISFRLFFHKSDIFSLIHQKRFCENKNFHFPAKIYEIRKNVRKQNCLFYKDLELWS